MEAAILIGGATNLVTEIIKALITIAKSAIRCQAECQKLQKMLEAIQPDVETIERQLHMLQEELQVVVKWLLRLKQKLHMASIKVHKCNSGSKIGRNYNVLKNSNLKTKITGQCDKISRLADQRVMINLQLVNMCNGKSLAHSEGSKVFRSGTSRRMLLYTMGNGPYFRT